jgi:hypothetical protein
MKYTMMKYWSFLILGVVLLSTSCRKDKVVITDTVIIGSEPAVYINTSITGVVTDEAGEPVSNANVGIEGFQTTTDDNGFFYLKDVSANQNGTSVQVEQVGFFPTSKLIYPELNRISYVTFVLNSSTEVGRLNAGDGGSVSFDGASITLPANGLRLNGQPYTGQVSVRATFIDPLGEDVFDRMPGSLIGINDEGNIVGMETYGMVGAELISNSGEHLEIDDNARAIVEFPLPTELQGQAPATIDLWHFDEASAYWVKEGEARLEGDKYVAEVAHFSFWNCDAPFDLVNAKGKVRTADGRPVPNTRIVIQRNSAARNTGTAYTDYGGYYGGKIPANEELLLEVYDLCDELVSSERIGPFSADVDLGVLEVEFPNEINVRGRILDCNSDPISEGYARIRVGEPRSLPAIAQAIPNADGIFEVTMGVCNEAPVTVTAHDLENFEKSDELQFAYAEELDLGDLNACGNIIYTFRLEVGGEQVVLENCFAFMGVDTTQGPVDFIYVGAEDGGGYVNMRFPGNGVGTYDVSLFDGRLVSLPAFTFQDPNVTVELTQWEATKPSVAKGTISGSVKDDQGNVVSISGSFTAERN